MQIVIVDNPQKGIEKAKEILYEKVDEKTVLFLSGGKTPRELYEVLGKEKKMHPGAVGLVDERFNYEQSNGKMIADTRLLSYLEEQNIPFYPVLSNHVIANEVFTLEGKHFQKKDRHAQLSGTRDGDKREGVELNHLEGESETTRRYDQTIRDLLFQFPKSVGIFGIGTDGHTAGIPASVIASELRSRGNLKEEEIASSFTPRNDNIYTTHDLIISHDIPIAGIGGRITMTFAALSLLDVLLVLVFGEDKKNALSLALSDGSIEEVPSRFFNQNASNKTLLITDQKM